MKIIFIFLTLFVSQAFAYPGDFEDLCTGTYTGVYDNGRSVRFVLSRTGYNELNVGIIFFGRESDSGTGNCFQRDDGTATVEMFMRNYPNHFATINDKGTMTGYQSPGFGFRAQRN